MSLDKSLYMYTFHKERDLLGSIEYTKVIDPLYDNLYSAFESTKKVKVVQEVVEDIQDKIIDFKNLLSIFFSTHDPTTLNRQGNDIGTQYRSIIFCENGDQIKSANFYIKKLENLKVYNSEIVTEVSQKEEFYIAETDHLNYYNQNKSQLYCRLVIDPKLKKFMSDFKDKLKK